MRAFSDHRSGFGPLGLDELGHLVHDDLAAGDLRRAREGRLELLVAHPGGRDARRLVGLLGGVEEADRGHDAVAGVDQVIAAEARQLAQAGTRVSSTFLTSSSMRLLSIAS